MSGKVAEPTKGLVAIACDECATVTILVADVLHIADEETYKKVLNGEVEMKATVMDGRVKLEVVTSGNSGGGQPA